MVKDVPTTPGTGGPSDSALGAAARGPRAATALRRPYPTAPTTTRLSPARETIAVTRSQSRRQQVPSAVPASVWTFDTGVPLDTVWPAQVVERVVASFTLPAGTVGFLPWPTGTRRKGPGATDPPRADQAPGEPSIDPSTGAGLVAAARESGFAARIITAATSSTPPPAAIASDGAAPDEASHVAHLAEHVRPSSIDLIVTATGPGDVGEQSADRVALLAARALRAGGILAVLTHCDWSSGVLRDPSGTVITAGQNADLLYLQHVVAVHGAVHHIEMSSSLETSQVPEGAAHHRVHSDVIVLVQPHDRALDLPNEAAA